MLRSNFINLALTASALVASASAVEAKPRRVVVLDFDGPRALADAGRSSIMSLLGEQYNIVSTKNWDAARARASGRSPQQWRQASKQAGVDAVIEGWVQTEGRHHVLTIAVRDAANGAEIDTLSIRIKETGVTGEATQKLATQLEDVLSWIDGDITAEPTSTLPDVRTMRPMLGARDPNRDRKEIIGDDDEEDRDDRRGSRRARRDDRDRDEARDDRRDSRDSRDDRDDRRADDRRDSRDDRDDRRDDRDAKSEKSEKVEKTVATADVGAQDTNDLVTLFGPESKEAAIVSEGKTAHVPVATPRFQVSAGGYLQSRGILFSQDPESKVAVPDYPASTLKGFAAHVGVYPIPHQKFDAHPHGLGFTLDVSKGIGAILPAMDETGYGDYSLDHTAYEGGVHYKWPIDMISIDGSVNYGKISHELPSDFPESVAIPDTSYSYVGAGLNVDLAVTNRASVGAGARYMYLLDAGMITSQDFYGAGQAGGFALDGNFVIPLPHRLYVRGDIEYRRVKIDFEGSGMVTQERGVWDSVDASITGTANIGVEF